MTSLCIYACWNDLVDSKSLMIQEDSQDNQGLKFLEHGRRR